MLSKGNIYKGVSRGKGGAGNSGAMGLRGEEGYPHQTDSCEQAAPGQMDTSSTQPATGDPGGGEPR